MRNVNGLLSLTLTPGVPGERGPERPPFLFLFALFITLLLVAPVCAAESPITAVAFTPDGGTVLLGSQNGVDRRSWPDLKPGGKVACKLAHVHDIAFAPDGKHLLLAGGTPGELGTVELLSWPDGKLVRRVTAGDDVVQAVAWRGDGGQWACASVDATCRVFDLKSDKPKATFNGHSRSVLSLIYLTGGEHLVSAGTDNSLRVWEAATGKGVRTLDNHTQPATALALRPTTDKEALPLVASGGLDRTVRLWQPSIGRMVRFVRLPSPVLTVAWTIEGKHVLAGCQDGQVRRIDPDSLDVVATYKALDGWIHGLAVDPKAFVAVGAKGQIKRVEFEREK